MTRPAPSARWCEERWHHSGPGTLQTVPFRNDCPAARYRDLGPDWHARHTDRNRKARNAQRQLEALGFDVVITLREDAA